ncbi:MAG: endonuclease/exonuclease/phosphatase family protein [Rhodothermales bacterium]|nr:endonuclease/exonuclease/phosphatase family protein [Rhodothermales bacterium]MBO6780812.1 endonuclease/exonuclease/phosphatase family protein [Rhodothermales bacterium]
MRVLTANLFSDRTDPAAFVEVLISNEVDVACVQELGASLADPIASVLPHGGLFPNEATRGLGIATRHPVEIASVPIPKRPGVSALLDPAHWPGLPRPMEVINWHVMGPHTWPYFPNPNTRRAHLRQLDEWMWQHPQMPRAVLGDYNASPIWPFYRAMRSRLEDAVLLSGDPPPRTWPALGLGGLIRIDHCFVSGLTCTRARRVELPGSDHFGLLVDLKPVE